jgi:hypothetical protein
MSGEFVSRARYGEAFWRAHHEAWRRSDLNQREYCEAQGIRSRATCSCSVDARGPISSRSGVTGGTYSGVQPRATEVIFGLTFPLLLPATQ